jgi:hypothetical protein
MKLSFVTKIDGKTSLGPNYFASQDFHSQLWVDALFMPKLAIFAPNRETLWITLLSMCNGGHQLQHKAFNCSNVRKPSRGLDDVG